LASAALTVGARAGAIPDLDDLVAEALDVAGDALARWRSDSKEERNLAKDLAHALSADVPAIWGQEGVLGVAAMRWKCQLNENAKMPASWATIPESLHNEIVPAEEAGPIVVLRSDTERSGIQRRIDALDLPNATEVRVPGGGDLAVFMAAALLGDLVSLYCAALRGVDPTPIEPSARLNRAIG
jgi:glucose/mannose-6-phosphate isomerase